MRGPFTKAVWWQLLCLIVAFMMLMGVIIGFVLLIENSQKEARSAATHKHINGHWMPTEATDITDVGNGWQEFTYKGERFLFYRHSGIETGYACIVKLESK